MEGRKYGRTETEGKKNRMMGGRKDRRTDVGWILWLSLPTLNLPFIQTYLHMMHCPDKRLLNGV